MAFAQQRDPVLCVCVGCEWLADPAIARRRNHAEIESALIASGLGYTLLRNNAYLQMRVRD